MIVPTPETSYEPQRRPMIWCLVGINLLIQFFVSSLPEKPSIRWSEAALETAGRVYLQTLSEQGEEAFLSQPRWIQLLQSENPIQMQFLGSVAIRRQQFADRMLSEDWKPAGDPVAIARLRDELRKFRTASADDLTSRLGLSSVNRDSLAWITYQFSHAGWIHLISNLVFLLLIGAAVERQLGSLGVFMMYLGGGWAGGLAFLHLQPDGLVPMVGASGAVSALMAFYALFEPRRRIRYFYFVLPVNGHMGYIHLSPLLIVPLYLVTDVAGLLSSPEAWSSGVAYSAHVGGALIGASMALWLRFGLRWRPLEDPVRTLES